LFSHFFVEIYIFESITAKGLSSGKVYNKLRAIFC
jgi:hypothetical protein